MIADAEPGWAEIIGSPFAGSTTTWDQLLGAAQWLDEIDALGGVEWTPAVREQLLAPVRHWPDSAGLLDACHGLRLAEKELAGLFEDSRAAALDGTIEDRRFEGVLALCEGLRSRVDDLHDWTEWKAWCRRAHEHNWPRCRRMR